MFVVCMYYPFVSVSVSQFKMGNQVEQLKAYLEQTFGIPYPASALFLGDEFMIDPLSLSDFKFNAAAPVLVTVKGAMCVAPG